MLTQFKRLATQSCIYGLAGILNAAIGFILVPLYARYLIPSDYGIVTISTTTAAFIAVFFQLGTGTAVFRSVIQRDVDEKLVLSTAFFFTLGITIPILVLLLVFSHQLASLLFGLYPDGRLFLQMVFIAAALDTIGAVPLARYRIEEKPVGYIILTGGSFMLGLVLNIYLVVVAHLGVKGILLASLIRASIFAMAAFITLLPKLRFTFSIYETQELLRYGLPLIPISISAWVLSVADRYFLQYYSSITTVGVYSVGYKLGSLLQLPVSAFQVAWPAIMFAMVRKPEAREFYARLLTYFCLAIGSMGLVVAVFAPEAIHLIADPQYFASWQIVPLVLLAQLMLGVYYVTAVGVNVEKRPELIIYAWLAAVIIHLGLNFVLIPSFGMLGAALSTLIAYTVIAVLATFASLRLYSIPYQYARLFKLALALVCTYLISLAVNVRLFGYLSLLKLALTLCFPFLLWVLGFFTGDEKDRLKAYLRPLAKWGK